MSDIQIKLGRALLKSLAGIQGKKGDSAFQEVGALCMKMAAELAPPANDPVVHQEIGQLVDYIQTAKKEIFAITTNEKSEAVITDASQHLDEVIKATEKASHSIMDAADAIQTAVKGIGGDREKQIMDASIRIYDACTFQDITGQRVRKVITLLENIEDRIGKLNGLFDTTGAPVVAATPAATSSEKDLLNGPQLAGKGVSQADVDAMFTNGARKN